MNTSALNTFEVNGELLDSAQRSSVVADVVAQILINPKVFKGAELLGGQLDVGASVTLTPRVICRVPVEFSAEALLSCSARSYSRAPAVIQAIADASFDGNSFAAAIIRSPVSINAEAALAPSPRMVARGVPAIDAEASIVVTPRTFSKVRSQTVIDASIELWVSVGALQRIPFYEYAVEERTIKVPQSDRKVMVT